MSSSTGVVVLLFTDLVGSTEVLDRLGDDAAEDLRRTHFALLRQAVVEAGGREVKTMGDGVMAAFTSPVRALQSAVAIQRSIADHNRRFPDRELHVRIGLHAGEPTSEEEDFFGTPVVVAKRLCDRARGGQILTTGVLADLVGTRGGFQFRPAGRLKLKGLAEPVVTVAVEWEADAERPARPVRKARAPRGPQLVGRERELAVLEAELDRVADGEFRCVLILGEAGVGKTRLAGELGARHQEDSIYLSARAYPLGGTASFGLWGEALERHLRGLPEEELTDVCGGFLDDLAGLVRSVAAVRGETPDREPTRFRLIQGVATVVGNLARRDPVIVLLDDMHLADASSWETLDYLAHNLADAPVLVLAAARPGELARAEVATHTVFGLDQEGFLTRLALETLDAGALARLAAGALGQEPPRPLVDWLGERSRGNPLFALGLLRALAEEGADLSAPSLRRLPEGLAERVTTQVMRLDDQTVHILEMLSVLGRRVEFGDLAQLSGWAPAKLAANLERLVDARFVVEEGREQQLSCEIAHPLTQEAVYENMTGVRARVLHRQVARGLRAAGRVGEAAAHFARSADVGDSEAIEALREAVREAERRGAYREALTVMGEVVALLPPHDPRWLEIADAISPHADWVYRGEPHLAALGVQAMRAIDSVLSAGPNPARRAAVKFRLANFLTWGTGELVEAEQSCVEAAALYEQAGDTPMKLLADCELAWIRGIMGDLAALQTGAGAVAEAAQAAGHTFVARQAFGASGYAAFHRGRFAEAESAIRRAIAIAREEGKPRGLSILFWTLSASLVCEGRLAEAQAVLEEARASDAAGGAEWARRELFLDWHAGHFRAALTRARDVVAASTGEQTRRNLGELVFACMAAVELDEQVEARQYLALAKLALGGREWLLISEYWEWVEALLIDREGLRSEALADLSQIASKLIAKDALASAAFVLADLVELAAESGDAQTAGDAALQLEAIAQQIDRDLYSALAALSAAWSSLASGAPKGASERARTAVELLSDMGYRPLLGRALEALGNSLADTDPTAARETLQEAVAMLEECGSVWRGSRALAALNRLQRPDGTLSGAG
ncbi:MAG TPA: AAA family ATPase [Acidimicrobiia bacterium]|jgi:class 3 adenylate cyclase/tetratricopeptide (TPR) repeat protein